MRRLLVPLTVLVCLLSGLLLAADKPVSDDLIVDQVRLRLTSDAVVKGGGLAVDSKGGVVTLSGRLSTKKEKERAGRVAGKVKGVKRVENNIVVSSMPEK
jgi:osmotically-inducible protein OsmY